MPLCYEDRAFCSIPCGYVPCPRRVSNELIKEAEEFGLPLSLVDLKCPKYIDPKLPDGEWPEKKGSM